MSFTPKPSKATHWWLGILFAVLVVLFVETKGHQDVPGSNFFINAPTAVQGADVIVDGRRLGAIVSSGADGVGGGAFWAHLTRGKHTVELRKTGFETFSKEIDMHGEEYMGVDLKPAKN
jgi:hypothetical protein